MTRASWKPSRAAAEASPAWAGSRRTWILASCLAAAIAVEVGDERRQEALHVSWNEKSPLCCWRRRGMGQLAFRIESERGEEEG